MINTGLSVGKTTKKLIPHTPLNAATATSSAGAKRSLREKGSHTATVKTPASNSIMLTLAEVSVSSGMRQCAQPSTRARHQHGHANLADASTAGASLLINLDLQVFGALLNQARATDAGLAHAGANDQNQSNQEYNPP